MTEQIGVYYPENAFMHNLGIWKNMKEILGNYFSNIKSCEFRYSPIKKEKNEII